MKKHLPTIILILVFCTGLGLLLYPTVSDYWNSLHQTRAIAGYVEALAEIDDDAYEAYLADAQAYNAALARYGTHWTLTEEEYAQYERLLNISGSGVMGYIEIPCIDCYLPIYHGTGEKVLEIAAGHIEGSSLPVGGESTHALISGHRGLPSAKLFTDLDKLVVGDIFLIHVLDETLTYEVDRILIVEPDDLSALTIEAGEDLCTLITCTPYGINTHRLLVQGHRVENAAETGAVRVSADALLIDKAIVAPLVAVPLLLLLLVWLLIKTRRRKK